MRGFSDAKRQTHTCFSKVINKPPKYPSGIISVDIETTTGIIPNILVAVYHLKPNDPSSGTAMKIFTNYNFHGKQETLMSYFGSNFVF